MKRLFKILIFSWTIVWLFLAIGMFLDTPKQILKDKSFIEKEIKPSVDFIKKFRKLNKRLPTNYEFYKWEREFNHDYSVNFFQDTDSLIQGRIGYIRHRSDIESGEKEKFKNVDWSKDFALRVWRGEWNEYYFSWTDRYDGNDYNRADGFIGLGIMSVIGILPLILWWVVRINKNKLV